MVSHGVNGPIEHRNIRGGLGRCVHLNLRLCEIESFRGPYIRTMQHPVRDYVVYTVVTRAKQETSAFQGNA